MPVYPADVLSVEIETFEPVTFVVGVSRLGHGRLTDNDGEKKWRKLECDLNSLNIVRGGEFDGVSSSTQAGTVTGTLVNSGDPLNDPGLIPNAPVRIRTDEGYDLFTGVLEDINVFNINKRGDIHVQFTAVDAVKELTTTTNRGDLVLERDDEMILRNYMAKILEGTGIPESAQHLPSADVDGFIFGDPPESSEFEKISSKKFSWWGTVPSDIERIDSLGTETEPFSMRETPLSGDYDQLETISYDRGVKFDVDTEPGLRYVVEVNIDSRYSSLASPPEDSQYFALGVDIGGTTYWGYETTVRVGQSVSPGNYNLKRALGQVVAFTADSSSHTMRLAPSRDFKVDNSSASNAQASIRASFNEFRVRRFNDERDYPVAPVAYETTKAGLLDMYAASGRYHWWVDRKNEFRTRRRVAEDNSGIDVEFTDRSDSSYAKSYCYTDITAEYSTRNIVNHITFDNHGVVLNPDNPEGNVSHERRYYVSDHTETYEDGGSVARYGKRDSPVDVASFPLILEELADDLLDMYKAPDYIVSSVTFAIEASGADILEFDLYDRVRVTHKGVGAYYFITGIQHTVTGDQWFVEFKLREVEG